MSTSTGIPASDSSAQIQTPRPATAIHVVSGPRRGLAIAAGLLMRAWCATLRVRCPEATLRLVANDKRPTLFVLWHNRLFAAARLSRLLRPTQPLHCLVSASKDGAWLSAFFESMGLRVVRGSSSRGGREAAAAMVDVLRAGHDAGITPDGPRGPIYACKPGAIIVGRRAKARVLVLGITYESAWSLRSWDRFGMPKPFSTVYLAVDEITPEALAADDARECMESRLLAMNPEFATTAAHGDGGAGEIV